MRDMRILALAAAVLSGGCVHMRDTAGWKTLDGAPPVVIAHRGASGLLPEHTLEAYALAIAQGADFIEPDLVVTKDGVLVARHERYLSGTTDVAQRPEFATRKRFDAFIERDEGRRLEDWWVEDFTLAELKTLRARQPREGRPKQYDGLYGIPTFAEVLALATRESRARKRAVGVYPETKHPDYFETIGLDFEEPLLDALSTYDAGPVFVQSFVPGILQRLQGKTGATLVQLIESKSGAPSISAAEAARYARAIGPDKTLVDAAFVAEAHRLGLRVHPWTYRNDAPPAAGPAGADEIEAALSLGVDGVFTDFPDTGVAAREAAARRR